MGVTTILDINYVDFLQFQRYFTPQAELEEAFIYIIHKPIYFSIDFSYRLKTLGHMVIGFKQIRVPIRNLQSWSKIMRLTTNFTGKLHFLGTRKVLNLCLKAEKQLRN